MSVITLTDRDLEELDKLSQATKGQDAQVKKWGYTAILNDVLQRTDMTIELQKESQARLRSVVGWFSVFFFLLAIVLAVNLAVTRSAMEMSKESHIKKGALTDKGGQVVKVSSTDFTLGANGVMVQRTSASGQRRLAEEGSTTVGTAPVLSEYQLSSRIPNKYMQELEQFSVVGDQDMMQVRVVSFKRVPQEGSHCGSIVVFQTDQGEFTLDDADLFHNGNNMEAKGFFGLTSRRLANMNMSAHGRRLIEEGTAPAVDAGLYGNFRFLAGINAEGFECEMGGIIGETFTVDPPTPPVIPYSYTVSLESTCDFGEELDACDSLVVQGAKPGVKQYSNFSTMRHYEQVLLTTTHRVVVSYFASQPLSRLVSITQIESQVVTKYITYKKDKTKLHCFAKPIQGAQGGSRAAAGYFLAYLGVTSDNGGDSMRWHLSPSHTVDMEGNHMQDTMRSLEYWERVGTRLPRRVFQVGWSNIAPDVNVDLVIVPLEYLDFNGGMSADEVAQWFTGTLSGELSDLVKCPDSSSRELFRRLPIYAGPYGEGSYKWVARYLHRDDVDGSSFAWPSSYYSYWNAVVAMRGPPIKLNNRTILDEDLSLDSEDADGDEDGDGAGRRLGDHLWDDYDNSEGNVGGSTDRSSGGYEGTSVGDGGLADESADPSRMNEQYDEDDSVGSMSFACDVQVGEGVECQVCYAIPEAVADNIGIEIEFCIGSAVTFETVDIETPWSEEDNMDACFLFWSVTGEKTFKPVWAVAAGISLTVTGKIYMCMHPFTVAGAIEVTLTKAICWGFSKAAVTLGVYGTILFEAEWSLEDSEAFFQATAEVGIFGGVHGPSWWPNRRRGVRCGCGDMGTDGSFSSCPRWVGASGSVAFVLTFEPLGGGMDTAVCGAIEFTVNLDLFGIKINIPRIPDFPFGPWWIRKPMGPDRVAEADLLIDETTGVLLEAVLVKEGWQCWSYNKNLGKFTLPHCIAQIKTRYKGKRRYFIWSHGSHHSRRRNKQPDDYTFWEEETPCRMEKTWSRNCFEGWKKAKKQNFYELDRPCYNYQSTSFTWPTVTTEAALCGKAAGSFVEYTGEGCADNHKIEWTGLRTLTRKSGLTEEECTWDYVEAIFVLVGDGHQQYIENTNNGQTADWKKKYLGACGELPRSDFGLPMNCHSCPGEIRYVFWAKVEYLCSKMNKPNGSPLEYTGRGCADGTIEWLELETLDPMYYASWFGKGSRVAHICRRAKKGDIYPGSEYFSSCGMAPVEFSFMPTFCNELIELQSAPMPTPVPFSGKGGAGPYRPQPAPRPTPRPTPQVKGKRR